MPGQAADDRYDISVMNGNHGPWLIVRVNGNVVHEAPARDSEALARQESEAVVAHFKQRRARQRACAHTWKANRFTVACTDCRAVRTNDGGIILAGD